MMSSLVKFGITLKGMKLVLEPRGHAYTAYEHEIQSS